VVHIARAHARTLTPPLRASRLFLLAVFGAIALAGIGFSAIGSAAQPKLIGTIPAKGATAEPAANGSPLTQAPSADPSAATAPAVANPSPVVAPAPAPSPLPELTAHVAVTDRGPIAPAYLKGYRWPLIHGRLTLPFGPTPWGSRVVNGELFHDGIDLATFCGDRITAAHDGVVLAASRKFDEQIGWIGDLTPYFKRLDAKKLWTTLPIVVITDDGNGYRSVYAHFGKVVVKPGQTVKAGQLIGYEGRTGHASGCHLHYGLFSPRETASFAIDPGVVERMKVPAAEIARIDPLLVLPFRLEPKAQPSASVSQLGPE
jgi:murein DD-endopeptidase MepM/ murein hydrolase activator NlpD